MVRHPLVQRIIVAYERRDAEVARVREAAAAPSAPALTPPDRRARDNDRQLSERSAEATTDAPLPAQGEALPRPAASGRSTNRTMDEEKRRE